MTPPGATPVRACAVVPSFNHYRALPGVLAALKQQGLAVFVVDDGNVEPARSALAALHDPDGGVTVARLERNQGKGVAALHGMALADAAGFTHALQVDADGQHDTAALPAMLALAERHPDALVTGVPRYDASAPLGRKLGRWITHVWVWIETLSFRLRDSMCGFRVYPLAAVRRLRDSGAPIGRRMDFDTEIMVRLFWQGTAVAHLPVQVIYPPGNPSNFAMLADNWRITCMHTRLFFGMLRRLPGILTAKPPRVDTAPHWAALAERGLYWGMRLCAAAYRLLGRRGCLAVLAPVVLYFYLTGREQRRCSHEFLRRAFAAAGTARAPTWLDGLRHQMSFAGRALDTFIAWTGATPGSAVHVADRDVLDAAAADPRGALFIVTHFGNTDLCRAVLDDVTRARLVVLVHTRHAENYNRLLREINPGSGLNLFQVTELGPDTAIALQARVAKGHWLVIAGDRTPIGSNRVSRVPFLGSDAPFSQGPYILAALLECPVYLLFCRRDGDRHVMNAEKLADRIAIPHRERQAILASHAARFAARLEHHALTDPFQWYNFFDFWADREAS